MPVRCLSQHLTDVSLNACQMSLSTPARSLSQCLPTCGGARLELRVITLVDEELAVSDLAVLAGLPASSSSSASASAIEQHRRKKKQSQPAMHERTPRRTLEPLGGPDPVIIPNLPPASIDRASHSFVRSFVRSFVQTKYSPCSRSLHLSRSSRSN